jgi:predicted porin
MGVRYDFGMASVGVLLSKGDAVTSSDAEDRSNSVITVNVPLGNGMTAHASKMNSKIQDSVYKSSGVMLALTKDLSKRTTVYGHYAAVTNEASTFTSFSGITTGTAGNDPKVMTVGVSHKF